MSGHSKWATIKRKKAATDAKRSKVFSKIVKEINIAIKEGGPDQEANARLRLAIQNGKGVNMPKDIVNRAISKASDKDSASYQESTYEGYAAGGIAVFVECLTDNINRTVSNVRAVFGKQGGNMGVSGSIDYLFSRKGVFAVQQGNWTEDDFMMEVIDAGAEEVELEEGIFNITTALEDYGKMQSKLEDLGAEVDSSEVERIAGELVEVDAENAQKVMSLIDALEEDDDVQNVFHNMELSDELMASLS
ncbi:MAG: YebC/PmpR family DNA-binding transcriptional regulator [Flavobacteriales bacterium]|nr:YebC/PmpR family DNA-binding transcriptional regulator [Flavobacteriales bacterium]